MPSTTLCDYQVLRDAGFTLDAATNNHDENMSFAFPDDFFLGDGPRMPILSFAYRAHEDCRIRVRVNSREVIVASFGRAKTRTFNEPFRAATAFPEGGSIPAQVPLRFTVDIGRATISNVILFYQINR